MERGQNRLTSRQGSENTGMSEARLIELLGVPVDPKTETVKIAAVLDACRIYINNTGEHLEAISEGERSAFKEAISDFRYSYGELD